MNKYLSYAILICAIAANTVNCYGPRPAVLPAPLPAVLPDYAETASSAAAASSVAGPQAEVITGPVEVYPQPAVGPAYGPAPIVPAYGPAVNAYGAPAPLQGPIQNSKYIVLPAGVAQLYPGPINYKVYNSPPEYSTVVLPVRPRGPAVKLFVPQQKSYSANLGSAY